MEYLYPSRRWSLFSQYRKGFSTFIITQKSGFDFHLQRIYTDADLYDEARFNKIIEAIGIIEDLKDIQMPENVDLVLDLNEDGNGNEVVDYYLADHEKRIIVFVEEFPSKCIPHWHEIKGVSSGTHLRMSSLPRQ
jgi:hypothetical protein